MKKERNFDVYGVFLDVLWDFFKIVIGPVFKYFDKEYFVLEVTNLTNLLVIVLT